MFFLPFQTLLITTSVVSLTHTRWVRKTTRPSTSPCHLTRATRVVTPPQTQDLVASSAKSSSDLWLYLVRFFVRPHFFSTMNCDNWWKNLVIKQTKGADCWFVSGPFHCHFVWQPSSELKSEQTLASILLVKLNKDILNARLPKDSFIWSLDGRNSFLEFQIFIEAEFRPVWAIIWEELLPPQNFGRWN